MVGGRVVCGSSSEWQLLRCYIHKAQQCPLLSRREEEKEEKHKLNHKEIFFSYVCTRTFFFSEHYNTYAFFLCVPLSVRMRDDQIGILV